MTNDSQGYSFLNYVDSSRRHTVTSIAKGDLAANIAASINFLKTPPHSPPQPLDVYQQPETKLADSSGCKADYVRFLSQDATNIPPDTSKEMLLVELDSVMSHVSIEQNEMMMQQQEKVKRRQRAHTSEDPLNAYLNSYYAS